MDVEKYKASIETHKFYDTVSNSIVVGQITISGAAFYLFKEIKDTSIASFPFFGAALCVLMLFLIYRKCAEYANVARNVAACIEENKPTYGVSIALKTKSHPATKSWKRGIYGIIHLLTAILVFGLLATAIQVACFSQSCLSAAKHPFG